MAFDVERIRKEFPMLKQTMSSKPLIYLDNASTTFKPKCVIEAMREFYEERYSTVHRAIYELTTYTSEKYSGVRKSVASFLNARREEEIVFTRGATEAINIVAQCYGRKFLKKGDEIIVSEMEHHANLVPWQLLAEEIDCQVKMAPIDDQGNLIMESFKKLLTHKTKICAVTHASNSLGTINPVDLICKMAREVGAITVIDGAQAVAHFNVDVQKIDCDFYAFSGHKLFGPTGIGILYGKYHQLEKMPPYHGGGDMVREVSFTKTTFQDPPLKFEAGTPIIAGVLGLGAALDYVKSLNRQLAIEHESHLLRIAREELKKIPGVKIFGTAPEKIPLISFLIDQIHPLDLGTMIGLKGIAIRTGTLCAQPSLTHFGCHSVCRMSIAHYNTEEEIYKFVQAAKELTQILIC